MLGSIESLFVFHVDYVLLTAHPQTRIHLPVEIICKE
jgi:hypothetical protein